MSQSASPILTPVSQDEVVAAVRAIAAALSADGWRPSYLVGIGRGGLVPAVYLSHAIDTPMLSLDLSADQPPFGSERLATLAAWTCEGTRLLFVDDINDSGLTIGQIRRTLADAGADAAEVRFATLIDNLGSTQRVDYRARTIDRATLKDWFVFPWEALASDSRIIADAGTVPGRTA
jgi:hypoxanthine phosphoribosyltransferase